VVWALLEALVQQQELLFLMVEEQEALRDHVLLEHLQDSLSALQAEVGAEAASTVDFRPRL